MNWDKSEAEAEGVAAKAGAAAVPVRRMADPRDAAPTAATVHVTRAEYSNNSIIPENSIAIPLLGSWVLL